jgi:hypothetical protein
VADFFFELANTTFRQTDQEKDYLDDVHISVRDLPFAVRTVFLRFSGGLEFDFCTADMDRIAIQYLKLRGVPVSKKMNDLLQAEPPSRCTFVVPRKLLSGFFKKER